MGRLVELAGRRTSWALAMAIVRAPAGAAVCRWPAGGRVVDSRSRRQRRLSGLLLLPAKRRSAVAGSGRAVARAGVATGAEGSATGAAGHRRFADEALWAACSRSRHSSRSHTGTVWSGVLLWTRVGQLGGDRATSLVGDDRPADLLVAVRAAPGRAEAPPALSLDISD